MASKNPFSLKSHLYILIHSGTGVPYAGRIQMQRLSGYLSLVVGAFALTVLGSLLFFRELELNRKLQDQVLELQTRDQLGITVHDPTRNLTTTAGTDGSSALTLGTRSSAGAGAGAARISDLTAECSQAECNIKLSMMTTAPGQVQGQLLIVLETEIPRIGAGNPTTQLRRRFFIYPGNSAKDELDQAALTALERSPFRFTTALQTTATFNFGKLLRPLAVNAYVFDQNRALVQHERKAIDTESGQD